MSAQERPEVIVFDVNETLSDMSPMRQVFEDVGAPGHLAATWFASVLRDGFALTVVGESASFVDLGTAALRTLLDPAALDRSQDDAVEHVMTGFRNLPVHPDVPPGIEALAEAGLRMVTLSNGSAEVGRSLLERAGLDQHLEAFLSVADVGIWKPAPRAYQHALARCGAKAHDAMLVAAHPWDVDGAHRAGLRTAWLDRDGRSYPSSFSSPDVIATDLVDLADQVSG